MKISNAIKMCLNYKLLGGILLVIVLLYIFVPRVASIAPFLLILVCPLSMVLMMAGMQHSKATTTDKVFVCPQCGLSYTEAERAKKCAAWCTEHHSCNLEITKYAIKS